MLVFLFLLGQALPQAQTQKIELPDIRFSLTFPESWQVQPGPFREPMAGVAELAPRKGLAVVTRRHTGIATQEALLRDHLGALHAQYESHEVLKKEQVNLTDSVRAWHFHIKGTARGNTIHNVSYMYGAFEQNFMITFSCKDDVYAELAPVFQSIIRTLQFDGPEGYEKTQKFLTSLKADPIDYADLAAQLKDGANIDGQTMNRLTAMHLAVLDQNATLVKWLLANGSEPSLQDENLFRMMGSPAIVGLLKQQREKITGKKEPIKTGQAKGMTLVWTSPEAQLFAGIKEPIFDYVKEAIEKGADLNSPEKSTGMSALAYVRWIIKEYKEVDLDPAPYLPVEELLVAAIEAKSKKAQN